MAQDHAVDEYESLPPPTGIVDLVLSRIEQAFIVVGALAIFTLMMTAVYQVLSRLLFNAPIRGYIDYVEQSSALLAFMGIAYAEHIGAHIRMEFVPQLLSRRWRDAIEIFGIIVALVVIGILVYATWFSFYRALTLGDSTMDIELPVWPSKLVVPVSLALLWLRLLLGLVRYASGILSESAKTDPAT
ncbi:MAG: TRAP transporter small permease subunit [Flavobacteriaceae bacterium]